jgi:uncharacterized integral membrane protein
MRTILRMIRKAIFIIVVALIMVFCLSNNQTVIISLKPLPFEIESQLFLVILLSFFGGIFIGFVCGAFALTKEKFKNFINGWKIKFLQRKVNKITDAKK